MKHLPMRTAKQMGTFQDGKQEPELRGTGNRKQTGNLKTTVVSSNITICETSNQKAQNG